MCISPGNLLPGISGITVIIIISHIKAEYHAVFRGHTERIPGNCNFHRKAGSRHYSNRLLNLSVQGMCLFPWSGIITADLHFTVMTNHNLRIVYSVKFFPSAVIGIDINLHTIIQIDIIMIIKDTIILCNDITVQYRNSNVEICVIPYGRKAACIVVDSKIRQIIDAVAVCRIPDTLCQISVNHHGIRSFPGHGHNCFIPPGCLP